MTNDVDYSDAAILYVYESVKTVEFYLASDRVFRIEVVKVAKGTANVHFDVRYYERQTLYKAADGTITATPLSGVDVSSFYIWVPDTDLPWVNRPTAESALEQALGWLAERRNNDNVWWPKTEQAK